MPLGPAALILLLGGLAGGCGGKETLNPLTDGGAGGAGGASSCGGDGGTLAPVPYAALVPPRQGLWVLDLTNETSSRALIARSLQGVVNRSAARLYIVDDAPNPGSSADAQAANQHWLQVYQDALGVSPTGMGNLDAALAAFAPELDGYLLVSEDEPWSINVAVTEDGTLKAVLATAADAPALKALGLKQIFSFVGLYPDGLSVYQGLAAQVGSAGKPAFAVMNTTTPRLHDFLIQQNIITLAGYTDVPEWAAVTTALSHAPPGVPIYGYTATTGLEEANSVTDISMSGDVLVASDTTPNLSYHLAARPPAITRPPAVDTTVDCASAELNVVIALSDGDNLVIETMLYPTTSYWLSPERGQIPISWSISPALATLAPSVLDFYTRTVAPGDELVMMIGVGYAYGSQMPNADWFYGESFAVMESLGLHVLWLFDPIEQGSGSYSWKKTAAAAATCGGIDGLLDGYYPSPFHSGLPNEIVGGVPVIRAQGSYSDGPADIAAEIQALLALPKAQRPGVAFYSAAAWTNPISKLVPALSPLTAQGVRFLNASAGVKCAKVLGGGDGGI